MVKFVLSLLATTLVVIGAAKLTFEANSYKGSSSANQPWAQDRMEFIAWNNEKWTAWIIDGVFQQFPQNTTKWSRHANASLAFIDWEGTTWQAKIEGEVFVLAYRGDWKGLLQRTRTIRYRDWQGNKKLRTSVQLSR